MILTCGLPGAGKTDLAKLLASTRSAVRLTKDEWLWALGATPWDEPTRQRVELELWRLAQEILGQGVSVVLDFGLWARIERDEMRLAARELGVGVELHYLDVEPDELWRRVEARNGSRPGRATQSATQTLTGGCAFSKRPMEPSWPYSMHLQTRVRRSTKTCSRVIRHAWKGAPVRRNRVPVLQCSG